jgi:hypothetical protein
MKIAYSIASEWSMERERTSALTFFHIRVWLTRLYETLHPPHHSFGDCSSLNNTLSGLQTEITIVKDWIRSLIHALNFLPITDFLSDLSREAILGLFFDFKEAGKYLFRGTPYLGGSPPLRYLLHQDRDSDYGYIVPRLISALQGTKRWALTAGVTALG